MSAISKRKVRRAISAAEFDELAERGGDITPYMDFSKAVVVRRVNVDFPDWMIKRLDEEALRLNVSRQAVIKMWINDRLARPGKRSRSPGRRRRPDEAASEILVAHTDRVRRTLPLGKRHEPPYKVG